MRPLLLSDFQGQHKHPPTYTYINIRAREERIHGQLILSAVSLWHRTSTKGTPAHLSQLFYSLACANMSKIVCAALNDK